jgi:hypothetical protein
LDEDAVAPPLTLAEVVPIVEPHLERLAQVIDTAWRDFLALRDHPDSSLVRASAGTRGMLMTDLVAEPAHGLFAGVDNVVVGNRYGRPWVNLSGGRVQVRFRSLTPTLQLCPSDSERQVRLAYHLGDPCLPGMPDATVLTAGYVVDADGMHLAGSHLVCHLGGVVHYSIALTRTASALRQLPLMPLSAPLIRSTRSTVRDSLNRKSES